MISHWAVAESSHSLLDLSGRLDPSRSSLRSPARKSKRSWVQGVGLFSAHGDIVQEVG